MNVSHSVGAARLRLIPLVFLNILGLLFSAEPGTTAPPEVNEQSITPADREHWSFRPLLRPVVPDGPHRGWSRNPIDRFILAKLAEAGLRPMPPAGRVTLIRRLTFDLIGLPPAPSEIVAFQRDNSLNAYERLVERLLASDAYGERWAQHWLDLARFAETDGFEHDYVRPDAWRYRDWVIEALNADMPYNEFVALQLAGDELRPDDPAAVDAARFLLCGPDMPDINLIAERQHNFLNDMTATVSSVFLGLQMGCAQCHDHKFDPISQGDFYRLRAFFEGAVRFENRKPAALRLGQGDAPRSYLMIRGDFRRKGPEVHPAFVRIVDGGVEKTPQTVLNSRTTKRRTDLVGWLTQADHPLSTRLIVNRLWQFHFGYGLSRSPSDFGNMGQWPSHPELLDWLAAELTRRDWSLKQLHRLIVTSATYRQASRPSDPDWSSQQKSLAVENWNRAKQYDPQNELLARMNRHRLEGEAIRDSLLAASETLNRRRGGPGIRPPLPKELLATLLKDQWPVTPDVEDHNRRSVYLFVRRNLRYPIFEVFDKPDTNASCPRRNRSTIAPQALMLLNSELALSAAKNLCGDLLRTVGRDADSQLELCMLRTLGRKPTAEEKKIGIRFLTDESDRLRQHGRNASKLALPDDFPQRTDIYQAAALTDYCLALFNLNEFIYID